MTHLPPALGGYIELELPLYTVPKEYQDMRGYNSARGALLAVLQAKTPSKLWLPYYICDAVLQAAKHADIPVQFYSLDSDLSAEKTLQIASSEELLYVNYFGLCNHHCVTLARRFHPNRIIIDNAQAFYSLPLPGVTTIYSPRKFFGLPDGALLASSLDVTVSESDEMGSLSRSQHLLKRMAISAEFGYNDFLSAEQSLSVVSTAGMSRLTRRLLTSVDMVSSYQRRAKNFRYLHARLSGLNELKFPTNACAPLCYPFLPSGTESDTLRQELQLLRIYIPRYWPEVIQRAPENSLESELSLRLLPLPCDQRYDTSDLDRIANAIERVMRNGQ